MKKFYLILTVLLSLSLLLVAENPNDQVQRELEKALEEIESDLSGSDRQVRVSVKLGETDEAADAAYFGFYIEDLTFPKAQELKYPESFGVLIAGVLKDSPAWHYRLREDDIIMQIGDKEVTNYAAFEKIRKSLRTGDQISMVIFRDGKVESLDMELGSRDQKGGGVSSPKIPGKKKLSTGWGGGTWIPMWFDLDMADINALVTEDSLGFNEFPESGVLHQGLGGKLSIGKNFFLGGQGTWYQDTKKKANPGDPNYHVWLRHKNLMGGVTLDRRIAFTKNMIGSLGLMVGGAYHELEFLNTDSNYDWSSLPETITGSNNTHFLLHKGYLVAQPRVELMYRFLGWLGLRAEVGYAFGYPLTKDWRVRGLENESYEVTNSPDTKYEGLTISIGPWFGF